MNPALFMLMFNGARHVGTRSQPAYELVRATTMVDVVCFVFIMIGLVGMIVSTVLLGIDKCEKLQDKLMPRSAIVTVVSLVILIVYSLFQDYEKVPVVGSCTCNNNQCVEQQTNGRVNNNELYTAH